GIDTVLLGMNEWAGLSSNTFTGVRKLQPGEKPVFVFHLPFILQKTIEDTERQLKKVGWQPQDDEDLIESNANSCLFAKAAERTAKMLLGFHPDTTRLAREVTAGFISKAQAHEALQKIHRSDENVSNVLRRAKVL